MRIGSLLIIFLLFCTSCNDSGSPATDADVTADLPDMEEAIDQDTDSSSDDVDIPDSDGDVDMQPAEADSDTGPDIDIDPDCPPLGYAGFPYFRDDGTAHFCRNCDIPTEYDPDCVSHLWDAINKEIYDTWKAGGFEHGAQIHVNVNLFCA